MRLKEEKMPSDQRKQGSMQPILMEFIDSKMNSAEIVFEHIDKNITVMSLLGRLNTNIKKYKLKNIKCHIRNGRVYLIKTK